MVGVGEGWGGCSGWGGVIVLAGVGVLAGVCVLHTDKSRLGRGWAGRGDKKKDNV